MTILDKIIEHKKKEVGQRKELTSVKALEQSAYFNRPNISMKKFLLDPSKSGIIAEFKRKSPSKGILNHKASVGNTVKGYELAGASAISVLTDSEFFGGSDEDLRRAREIVEVPLLRKDFIIDEYQIIEAKAMGANIILLIASVLEPEKLRQLAGFAKSLDLEVLLEVHDEEELLKNCCDPVDAVGVNNRNLKDFSTSIDTSLRLAEMIPSKYLKVAESGINSPRTVIKLKEHGFNGFLIGENFMTTPDPGEAMIFFVKEIKKLELYNQMGKTKPI